MSLVCQRAKRPGKLLLYAHQTTSSHSPDPTNSPSTHFVQHLPCAGSWRYQPVRRIPITSAIQVLPVFKFTGAFARSNWTAIMVSSSVSKSTKYLTRSRLAKPRHCSVRPWRQYGGLLGVLTVGTIAPHQIIWQTVSILSLRRLEVK